ncbi:Tetratricopeptide repeat protein 1 [Eumeta japonica]|uniref:Tetratricopeptide repeat protein 1 n=1 Tax=Eumeta variegata TaxID=151549 RepID=A0A4C1YQS7_EUMVA|nr:Tetratricopeptide repeat protein 1 [Eumeta japonica]
MSERLKRTSQVSNEEVVQELTQDFKSSLNVEEQSKSSSINPGRSSNELHPSSEDTIPTIKPTKKDYDKDLDDQERSDAEECDDDSIDETALKEEESELTEDQKEERKIVAEELKSSGNAAFKNGDYELSIEKYTEGLKLCPLICTQQRAVLYCNRSAAKMKLERYKGATKDCTKSIELDDKYLKAYVRRAQCYESMEKFEESLSDYKKILELDPSHKEALKATIRLPPLIEEKNEKLKKEMFGKLKDLGNMILKPFGLSTDNFQLQQDPETNGYKINFKQ